MVKNQDTENKDHILASGIHTVISQYHFTELYVLLYIPIQVFTICRSRSGHRNYNPSKKDNKKKSFPSNTQIIYFE